MINNNILTILVNVNELDRYLSKGYKIGVDDQTRKRMVESANNSIAKISINKKNDRIKREQTEKDNIQKNKEDEEKLIKKQELEKSKITRNNYTQQKFF